jgi:astacin (peptidase family M12A)/VCBS repeat protein
MIAALMPTLSGQSLGKLMMLFAVGAVASVTASAATFAPTSNELREVAGRTPDARLQLKGMISRFDTAGRRFYELGDMRYAADAVEIDGAFSGRIWPGGVVYYQFGTAVTAAHRQSWRAAAALWHAVARVSFVETTGSGNYVRVLESTTANDSFVGMIGGEQSMDIASWDNKFIIAHEVGHALGLIHEHSRPDRDTYVSVFWSNIDPGQQYNFDIDQSGVLYGGYDFDSLMHYGRRDFSINGQDTIQPTPAYYSYIDRIGQTTHLSALDKAGMAQRYGTGASSNDNFAQSQGLAGPSGDVSGNNVAATEEPGEPTHGGPGGTSIWYSWTPLVSGYVAFDTYGSNFDTLLEVAQGSDVSHLISFGTNDDSGGTLQSSLTVYVIAGQKYYIAVDGYGGSSGIVVLNWRGGGGKGDVDGDGDGDLVWQNSQTGAAAIWFLADGVYQRSASLPTAGGDWRVAGSADCNADGYADLIWENPSTGAHAIWFFRDGVYQSGIYLRSVAAQWQLAAAADINRDGHADLVWQNRQTGQRAIWFLRNGVFQRGVTLPSVVTSWHIAAATDLDGDGDADLVWQSADGSSAAVWFLRDGTFERGEFLPTPSAQWQIAGAGDFNADGHGDLVWQNTSSGQRAIWLMHNGRYQRGLYLPSTSPDWEIALH